MQVMMVRMVTEVKHKQVMKVRIGNNDGKDGKDMQYVRGQQASGDK